MASQPSFIELDTLPKEETGRHADGRCHKRGAARMAIGLVGVVVLAFIVVNETSKPGPRGSAEPSERQTDLIVLKAGSVEDWSVQVKPQDHKSSANHSEATAVVNFTQPADPCSKYSRMRLDKVLHNNLGHKGPDLGEEGIVYEGVYIDVLKHQEPLDIEVHINALGAYTPNAAGENGFSKPGQKYESINIGGGTSVKLNFRVLDSSSKRPITLDHLELTFFDLDTGASEHTVESVEVNRLHSYYVTKNTEIVVTNKSVASRQYATLTETRCKADSFEGITSRPIKALTFQQASIICDDLPFCGGFQYHPDWEGGTVPQFFNTDYDCLTGDDSAGWTAYMTSKENSWVFTATTEGDGSDNPVDPMTLTEQQRNRAVTLTFRKINEFNATIASTDGWMPRYFTFLGRPSVLCALTPSDEKISIREQISEVLVNREASVPGKDTSTASMTCCFEILGWRSSMCSGSRSWWCRATTP